MRHTSIPHWNYTNATRINKFGDTSSANIYGGVQAVYINFVPHPGFGREFRS